MYTKTYTMCMEQSRHKNYKFSKILSCTMLLNVYVKNVLDVCKKVECV